MSLRCRLGRHDLRRVKGMRHTRSTYTTYTNAVCQRCGRRAWVNWPARDGAAT